MPLFDILSKKNAIAKVTNSLPGRDEAIVTAQTHFVSGRPLNGPYPQGLKTALFGLGCFWGAERVFWEIPGVWVTAVGYAAGHTPNPTYQEVCSGGTGHNEAVLVVYDPDQVRYGDLLRRFFEAHDPTQGMRQGNDVGTQYRSGIYVFDDMQRQAAEEAKATYQEVLTGKGLGRVTTEIADGSPFYFAEDDHQQYLAKNPGGYCGLGGTGIACPIVPAEAAS